jgi:hypothetical protein
VSWRDVRKLVEAEGLSQHRRKSWRMLRRWPGARRCSRRARLPSSAARSASRAGRPSSREARDRCEALQVALEGVRRVGQINQVRLASRRSRSASVACCASARLDATLTALVRHVAQVGADAAAEGEGERVRRVSRDRGLLVLEELERHHARLAADALVRAEVCARTSERARAPRARGRLGG